MNIVFLDVDGVLNSFAHLLRVCEESDEFCCDSCYPFSDYCLNNLKKLVSKTNSKIVISSFWRDSDETLNLLLSKLDEYDLKKDVIGCTPLLYTSRANEINEYLSSLDVKPNFVILDDDFISEDLNDYLVKVNSYVGLTSYDVDKGLYLLNKNR